MILVILVVVFILFHPFFPGYYQAWFEWRWRMQARKQWERDSKYWMQELQQEMDDKIIIQSDTTLN